MYVTRGFSVAHMWDTLINNQDHEIQVTWYWNYGYLLALSSDFPQVFFSFWLKEDLVWIFNFWDFL